MSSPFQEIQQLLTSAEGPSRGAVLRQLHEIIVSAETPEETATRIALYPLQTSAIRIGHDLKIFEILNDGPKSLGELVKLTRAHPITLGRLLKYMASVGIIRESGANLYESNKKSRNLATSEAVTIMTHFFENCSPLFQEMPAFLRRTSYQDVTDAKDTVFQPAYKTDLDTYSWFSQNLAHKVALIKYMGLEENTRGRWLDEYPFELVTQGWDPKSPVFVDIGGNVGHYCAKFKEHFPNVPGHVILQDLPSTLAHALHTPGVEALPHDFFEPQPIKSAKFYHLGWVLHNWNDEKSMQILRQIKPAMAPDSVLLINDMVLPESGVPPFSTSLDLVMLGACAGRERTLADWKNLFCHVGLAIVDCNLYDRKSCHGLISVGLA
ncbi:hypothetical protein SLS63_001706 [Diaporthe eres]|uniref:O-methyltransferase C-terminal domain-containing protein n=1 Tax=Diaporthe eres TaxID=83184 RepID=A0ABR1PL06_DIAER